MKDMCFEYGIWGGLHWMCMFSQDLDLDLVSGECFFVTVQVFPYFVFSLSTGYLGLGGFQDLRLFSLLSRPL